MPIDIVINPVVQHVTNPLNILPPISISQTYDGFVSCHYVKRTSKPQINHVMRIPFK